MIITATAPNRIDLCGGTLDVYPAYLLLGGAVTVNAAISIKSRVRLETRKDGAFRFINNDTCEETPPCDPYDIRPGTPFDLAVRVVRQYRPASGLDVYTKNDAPFGSGLGASSALLIALSAALNRFNKNRMSKDKLILHGADIEAGLIGIPTGKQDYYAAAFGGISAINFQTGPPKREAVDAPRSFLDLLDSSLVIAFTGKSHFSAKNNWAVIKNIVEKDKRTVRAMTLIGELSKLMRRALVDRDIDEIAKIINLEWAERKKLAKGVTTQKTETMIRSAKRAGALAAKLCGAGGGGCLLAVCEPNGKRAVENALTRNGARILPARIVKHGIVVRD